LTIAVSLADAGASRFSWLPGGSTRPTRVGYPPVRHRFRFTCIDVETPQGLGRAIVQVGDSDGVNTEIVAGGIHAGEWIQDHR
jgi:hypothetical protein